MGVRRADNRGLRFALVRVLHCVVLGCAMGVPARAATAPPHKEEDPTDVSDVTSRPGIGDATRTVPQASVMVNPGFTLSGPASLRGGQVNSVAPDLLVRAGLTRDLELRAAVVADASRGALSVTPSFAFGVQVMREDRFLPEVLVIPSLFLPSTGLADAVGELRVSAGRSLGAIWVDVNAAALLDRNGPAVSGTLAAGAMLPGGLGPFVEIYAHAPWPTFAPDMGVDAGLGWKLTRNLAFDISAGWTFFGDRRGFVSLGASILWP